MVFHYSVLGEDVSKKLRKLQKTKTQKKSNKEMVSFFTGGWYQYCPSLKLQKDKLVYPDVNDQFWCFFFSKNEEWFPEACFLSMARRNELKELCK